MLIAVFQILMNVPAIHARIMVRVLMTSIVSSATVRLVTTTQFAVQVSPIIVLDGILPN